MTDYDWRTKDELRKRIEELEVELLQARVAGDIYVEHLKAENADLKITNRQVRIDNAQLQATNQALRAELDEIPEAHEENLRLRALLSRWLDLHNRSLTLAQDTRAALGDGQTADADTLDAHLKEDAEREAKQAAELAALREERDRAWHNHGLENGQSAHHHLVENAELEACRAGHAAHDKYDEKLEAELAEYKDAVRQDEVAAEVLREELADARAERDLAFKARDNWRRDHDRLQDELAELRRYHNIANQLQLEKDQLNEALTELRGAVRAELETLEPVAYRLPASAWNLVYNRLRQLSEEE